MSHSKYLTASSKDISFASKEFAMQNLRNFPFLKNVINELSEIFEKLRATLIFLGNSEIFTYKSVCLSLISLINFKYFNSGLSYSSYKASVEFRVE